MPPTHCGPTGRLRQLILAGAGLNCGGNGLPPTFSQLAELTTLDLAYNKIGGTTDALGTTLGGVRTPPVATPGCLNVFAQLLHPLSTGSCIQRVPKHLCRPPSPARMIPHCLHRAQLPSLRRLYMRYTNLTGSLECSLVSKPSLTVVSLSGNMGITGPIPDCYMNVRARPGRGAWGKAPGPHCRSRELRQSAGIGNQHPTALPGTAAHSSPRLAYPVPP